MSFKYYEDPILGKGRAQVDVGGGTCSTSYVGGERIAIAGETISFVNSADIVNVTGTIVTLQPDTAYKIYATSQAITLNANPPAAGKWAYEGHIELFVAGAGYVQTGSNVVLANALEPDSVNNCTVRFHDGIAIIAVEDHVAGYIVVNGSTAGSGSLAYGIATSTNDYVAFDASLNGQTIPLAGAVSEGEKHVVGNGYTETAITGAVNCGTSKFTVANLSLDDVQVTGGVMTLGDAYIPSGSTVAVSGGSIAVEKVTGNGGVIDLGGTFIQEKNKIFSANGLSFVKGSLETGTGGAFFINQGNSGTFTNCTFTSNGAARGGAIGTIGGKLVLSGCSFAYNSASNIWGGACFFRSGTVYMRECTFEHNSSTKGIAATFLSASLATIRDCTFGGEQTIQVNDGSTVSLAGSNKIDKIDTNNSGTVILTSGASINLTSSIAPNGGIQVVGGTCTVNGVTVEPGTYTSIVSSGGSAVINQ